MERPQIRVVLDAELQSDLYGTRLMKAAGYDPRAAVSLQETFVRLSEGKKQNWLNGLFASHPPSQERVAKNRETVAALGGPSNTPPTARLRSTKNGASNTQVLPLAWRSLRKTAWYGWSSASHLIPSSVHSTAKRWKPSPKLLPHS